MSEPNETQQTISAWARATFSGQTPQSKIAHLKDELAELEACPDDKEEIADLLILLLNVMEMAGGDWQEEVNKKMAKNRARTWSAPDERGVCHHI
jgi:NTP pyrophosphatase (non-canonical NTP hydrolase)